MDRVVMLLSGMNRSKKSSCSQPFVPRFSDMALAWGRGVATIAADGSVLDTWYRHMWRIGEAPAS